MARHWTIEERARQSEIIGNWKPWQHSTGAKTPEGKAIISQNVKRGQAKRLAAIEQTRLEIEALQAKVRKLRTRGADVSELLT
uniref:Uncharacterized protein n=1 Tax=mine drainage metagenome TaxID=410659 RepID=E6QQ50_9ZZZZ